MKNEDESSEGRLAGVTHRRWSSGKGKLLRRRFRKGKTIGGGDLETDFELYKQNLRLKCIKFKVKLYTICFLIFTISSPIYKKNSNFYFYKKKNRNGMNLTLNRGKIRKGWKCSKTVF